MLILVGAGVVLYGVIARLSFSIIENPANRPPSLYTKSKLYIHPYTLMTRTI